MKTKIAEYRQEHPYDTLEQIGKQFNVSKQYIYKVLKQAKLPTKSVQKRKVKYCLVCGNSGTRIPFYRKRGQIINKYNRGYNKIYCSRQCYYRGQRDGLS